MYIYIYILVWTRAYPCTEQGRAERCATEWSVREHRLFEQLPRTWLRMPFWARLRAFMPSLLRSFASLRPRGRTNPNSISTSSQYRSKYTWEIHSKIIEKSIQNRWKSVLGAILAQDDTSLEPSWPKMTPRIEFLSIFNRFGGAQNALKIHSKMKQFSDTHWNLVFCAWSSQTLQNEGPKQLPNEAFSAQGQNPKIVLSPRRGLSLRGLKQSKITSFFRTICVSPGHAALVPLFSRFIEIFGRNGSPESEEKRKKNRVQNWCLRGERSSSSREHECPKPPKPPKPRMEI